jgi:hypothetical protein
MISKKIRFISNRPWLTDSEETKPSPIVKHMPDWFREADRFAKDPSTDEYYVGPDKGKIPTWKACPALFDVMSTGYTLSTPCNIDFFINGAGNIDAKVEDPKYQDFCTPRYPMPQFKHPAGFYEHHFAWAPQWAVGLPKGYSALYVSPLNRYDLPFMTVSGIIDNDNVNLPGSMPFFVRDGFVGRIEAGTPYMQIIPFLREDWKSSFEFPDYNEMMNNNIENSKKYRIPDGGVYKNKIWSKRSYE